jgi:hypothetical protein
MIDGFFILISNQVDGCSILSFLNFHFGVSLYMKCNHKFDIKKSVRDYKNVCSRRFLTSPKFKNFNTKRLLKMKSITSTIALLGAVTSAFTLPPTLLHKRQVAELAKALPTGAVPEILSDPEHAKNIEKILAAQAAGKLGHFMGEPEASKFTAYSACDILLIVS